MDTQPLFSPEQQPVGPTPNQLSGVIQPEQQPQPMPSVAAAQNSGQPAGSRPILTANDVANAIASVPMPTAPVVPAVAADVDVVEPEWVDAAEMAIAKNANNPYAEEE